MIIISIKGLYSFDSTARNLFWQKNTWAGLSVATIGTHYVLYQTWYSKEPQTKFHWINDNKSWLQMDKVGHVYGAYFSATAASAAFRHVGYSKHKSALLGVGFSLAFQMPIEYFDGRCKTWGASKGDMIANATGTLAAGLQNWFWGNARIPIRISFHGTPYSSKRPALLGKSIPERMLKDYNGQTYWIDFNPERIRIRPKFWPRWLGVNIGYGVEGLLGGDDNSWIGNDGKNVDFSNISRYRQFYAGPSISFGYLKNHPKRAVRIIAYITDKIRFPMPTIEYSGNRQWKFHPMYR